MPRKIYYACDIETSDGLLGQNFSVGCVTYKHEPQENLTTKTFYNQDDFCSYVLDKPYPNNRFYFHNLGFDIRFILDYCMRNKVEIPSPIIRGGNYICQDLPINDKQKVRLVDSYSLIPISLEKFTKVFELEESKIKVDFNNTNKLELTERCRSDTRILFNGLEKFFNIFPNSKRYITLPQISMSEFTKIEKRYQFTTKQEGKEIRISPLEETARLGYYGGRNEIFDFNFNDNTYCYDINSLYPFVMRNNLYPISIIKGSENDIKNYPLYYVKAKVNLPYFYIPPLPVKYNNKLTFTIGKFEGWFYSPEFNIIKDIADSYEIQECYLFEADSYFKWFIDKYWNLRLKLQSENNAFETLVKLYMNSLYGKFGQKRDTEGYSYIWDIDEYIDKGKMDIEEIKDGIYIKKQKASNKGRKINPYISGFITSYARSELWKNLYINDRDSLYTDTDSIFTKKPLNNVGSELGQFKLVGKGLFKPVCLKTYYFQTNKGSKHKAKGIYKNNIIQTDDYDKFLYNIWYNDTEIYAKTKESIRRFGTFLHSKRVIKSLNLLYDKREILPNLMTEPKDL